MDWASLPWTELKEEVEQRPIVLLPIGATEAHGPHLALDADVAIAGEVARRAAAALEERGFRPLILPPLAYSVTAFAKGFPGTIGIGEAAARLVLMDLMAAVAAQGIRTLVLVNHHLEPKHVEMLRDSVSVGATLHGLRVAFPDQTRRAAAARLGGEFGSGDCHAGRYETSIVLASAGGAARVREEVRRGLAPREVGLVEAIRAGKRTFAEAGMDAAYCGDPAAATPEEGEGLLEALVRMTVEAALEQET